jgi:hypothetical protein
MQRLLILTLLGAGLLAASATAQDYTVGSIKITKPWARATPDGAKVAGGFMTLTNTGTAPDRLVGGTALVSGKFEVHEMVMDGNVMKMRALGSGLEIKPGATVVLKPGGYHVMFLDLKQGLKAGEKFKGSLVFEKAGKIDVEYAVEAVGAAGSGHGHGGGHHGK